MPCEHGLHTSIGWAGWTITAYSLGFVVMLPVSGRLSELYGCRRVFLGPLLPSPSRLCAAEWPTIFTCSLPCARYRRPAARASRPSATKIIVDNFGNARDRAVGLFGSIFSIGAMIGPVFGGLFVTYWSWRGIFLVNVPIGLAVAALALRYVPARSASARGNPSENGCHGHSAARQWLAFRHACHQLSGRSGDQCVVAVVRDRVGRRDSRAMDVLSSHQSLGATHSLHRV